MNKKEYDRARYLSKKEEIDLRNKKYNQANKEKIAKYGKAWYEQKKQEVNKKRRDRYQSNKEKEAKKVKEWRNQNREKLAHYSAKRRCKKLQQTPKWADLEAIKDFYMNRPDGYEVDHIIPLAGKNVCGLHVLENLQYLPISKNRSKGNRLGDLS